MKNLKFLSALLFISILSLTSCQDEIDDENGNNPNTNSATSPTAQNLERTAMYDGSFDDFLDDVSCSSVLFPVTVIVDNTEITLVSESDYELVLDIIGEFTDDDDSVQFQFPITVQLSNYTQVVINNEAELDALEDACDDAEDNFEDAINCLEIDFPITILTYDANLEQSGSVVIESEQQLYNYMDNFDDDAYFSVNYPITATLSNGNTVEITSDADLENYIDECLDFDDMEDDAEDDAEDVEEILVELNSDLSWIIVAFLLDSSAISWESVDKIISSNIPLSLQVFNEFKIKELFPTFFKFLFFILVDPPRAGIIAIVDPKKLFKLSNIKH